jgi:hypothetical protein
MINTIQSYLFLSHTHFITLDITLPPSFIDITLLHHSWGGLGREREQDWRKLKELSLIKKMEKDYEALMKTEERTTRELRQTLGY